MNKKRKNLIGQSRLLKERHSKIFPTIFLPKIITRFWYHIPCFQRNVFLPWMENVILWSSNFAKVETSFPSLFKTLPEISKNTRRSFLKIIRGRILFNWFLDIVEFLAMVTLVKLWSIICRMRFTALLHQLNLIIHIK